MIHVTQVRGFTHYRHVQLCVVCMFAVLCEYWYLWLTCEVKMETVHAPLLSKPSKIKGIVSCYKG